MENKSDHAKEIRGFGLFAVIVSELIGFTISGIGLGYLAWTKWGAPAWVLLATSSAGLALAFYRIYRLSQREL